MWSLRGTGLRLAATALVSVLLTFTACQRYEEGTGKPAPKPAKTEPAPAAPAVVPPPKPQPPPATTNATVQAEKTEDPKVVYSPLYDDQIKGILKLANEGRWQEAEVACKSLIAKDPTDTAAQRLLGWIQKTSEELYNKALEDRIREIDAKYSGFNPTLKGLFTESKDRGLPPRKDVRDTVAQIEATPYIPDSYGRTNVVQGVLFDFDSQQGNMAKLLEKPISVRLTDTTLEAVLFNIAQNEGINFVADKSLAAFQQKLMIDMGQVKISELLKYIARNYDLQFQVGDDLVWIVDNKDPKKAMEETRFYKLRKGLILPARFGPDEVVQVKTVANNVQTVTESQKLNVFVNDLTPQLISLERAITNFFIGSKYYIDYERNTIVARGTREQLEVMDKIVREFDKPIQQVLIEARFITLSQPAFLKLGVAWQTGNVFVNTDGEVNLAPNLGIPGAAVGLAPTWTNILNQSQLAATISAIEQSGESQTLSAPRLTVLNNLPAKISDGKVQYYYEEYQVKQQILEYRSTSQLVPSGKPTKIQSGADLGVLASIGNDGRTIFLALNPRVNSDVQLVPFANITDTDAAGRVVSQYSIKLPQYRTQELSTRVAVRSGQTVVMGGVLERSQVTYVESVPVLGNLPILGALFRRRTDLDTPRYLLVFVTATLLAETGEYLQYEEEVVKDSGAGTNTRNAPATPAR